MEKTKITKLLEENQELMKKLGEGVEELGKLAIEFKKLVDDGEKDIHAIRRELRTLHEIFKTQK